MKHLSFDVDDETYVALLEEYEAIKADFEHTDDDYPFNQYLQEVVDDALKTDEENAEDDRRISEAIKAAGDRGATAEQIADMANDPDITHKKATK